MKSARKGRVFARPVVGFSLALQKTPKFLKKAKKTTKPLQKRNQNLMFSENKPIKPPKESAPLTARRRKAPKVEVLMPKEPQINHPKNLIQENSLNLEAKPIHEPVECPYHRYVKHEQAVYADRFSSLKRNAESGQNINDLCPICSKELGKDNVVILSCGHIVHRVCLSSFGRLSSLNSKPKCPVCHSVYQIIDLKIDPTMMDKCALKIQNVFRGYLVRRDFESIAPPGSYMLKRIIVKKAEKASNKLTTAMEHQNDAVDAMISSIDHELEWARNVMKSVEAQVQNVNWREVRNQIMMRNEWKCMIYLRIIDPNDCEITSCCHCFNRDCLNSWINYCLSVNNQPNCPECRAFFQHRKLREYRRPRRFADELDDILFS